MEEPYPSEVFAPRPNFDGFFNGFVTIFIMFIGEDWQTVMFEHYRGDGIVSIFFFPVVYISLYLIMLNLFLAILLERFAADEEEKKGEDSDENAFRGFRVLKRKLRKWWRIHVEKKWNARIKPSAKDGKINAEEVELSRVNLIGNDDEILKQTTGNNIKVSGLYEEPVESNEGSELTLIQKLQQKKQTPTIKLE